MSRTQLPLRAIAVALALTGVTVSRAAEDETKQSAAAPRPWVVLADDDLPIYRTVVTGIAVEAAAPVQEYSLGGDATFASDVVGAALALDPPVVVAVGPKAANAARKAQSSAPLVYCMVPRPENYRLSGPRVYGVRLERGYGAQLEALKAILPDATRVAVLYDPSRTARTFAEARKAADKLGLALVPIQIRGPEEAAAALSERGGDAQALWMVSDPTVLNLQTFEAMLAFAAEKKLPFFALNAGFVERGALFSFSVDYARLGRQVGRLAGKAIDETRGDTDQSDKGGLFAPAETELALNLTTAEAIGGAPELYARLLAWAASNRHSVRVYR